MIQLDSRELALAARIQQLKAEAGSHSPSVITLAERLPELKIDVDACFLSNPLATDLFLKYLKAELLDTHKIRDVIEFYPSQNAVIGGLLARYLGVAPERVFVGNGAIEIIQAVLHGFARTKVLVNIPTFSPYYEFVPEGVEVVYNTLRKEENYLLDLERYIAQVRQEKPDTVVLINPNNPDGGYIPRDAMKHLLESLRGVDNVILDESFIHFAFEDDRYGLASVADLTAKYPNVILVKSMSKDFGIAGIRAGYGILPAEKARKLLERGYLWNSNGLNEYFFRLYTREDFNREYERVRVQYIQETQQYFARLSHIPGIKVYPTRANFALVEFLDGSKAADVVTKLLVRYGIYGRTCADKIGLEGEFIRLSSRTREQNERVFRAFSELFEGSRPCASPTSISAGL